MDRDALADFLKRRRAALRPADVGLPTDTRRRTAGLRREEVADLAYISVGFYTRLEQGRGSRPSLATTNALADALRLTPLERNHLHALTGHLPPRPRPRRRSDTPSPVLLTLIERIDAPAQIVTDLGVTLAQNHLARALVGDQTRYQGLGRSIVYRWFTDPAQRRLHPEEDHPELSRSHVASLRAVHGAPGADPEADELVAVLLERSPEFAALWQRHEVADRTATKRFVHPRAGTIDLHCSILTAEDAVERLVVFAPQPGSEAEHQLALLARPAPVAVGA